MLLDLTTNHRKLLRLLLVYQHCSHAWCMTVQKPADGCRCEEEEGATAGSTGSKARTGTPCPKPGTAL